MNDFKKKTHKSNKKRKSYDEKTIKDHSFSFLSTPKNEVKKKIKSNRSILDKSSIDPSSISTSTSKFGNSKVKGKTRLWKKISFVFPRQDDKLVFFEFEKHGLVVEEPSKNTKIHRDLEIDEGKKVRTNERLEEILYGSKRAEEADVKPAKVTLETQIPKKPKKVDVNNKQSSAIGGSHDQYPTGHLSGLSAEQAARDEFGCRPRANSTDGELNLPRRGLCDEHMVIGAYKWNTNKEKLIQASPKGFNNLGNTCFLNSTLQCLAYLPPFCQCLLAMAESTSEGKNNNNRKQSQGKRITLMLRSLFKRLHNTEKAGAIEPRKIVGALATIGSCGSRNGYRFRPGRQEDAHEFLVHLLDAMNDGELRDAGINQHISGWRDRLPVHRLDETTFIHRIFGGYLRSQVRCTLCKRRSNTYDPFLDLSLEVSQKSCNSVATAFAKFTRKETLDTANRWKCTGCGKHVCATKQLTVFRPPLSLCIQMKRFAFSGGSALGMGFGRFQRKGFGMMKQGGTKISKPIEFPSKMKLPLSDSRSCEYALTGIVNHHGGSSSSGHYTAYVKKPGQSAGSNQWYLMDDSFVQPVSEKTVLAHKDAYVLFYCRTEVKVEFPSPPLRSSMSAEQAKDFSRARSRARADSLTNDDRGQHCSEAMTDSFLNSGKMMANESAEARETKKQTTVREESLHNTKSKKEPKKTSGSLQSGDDIFVSLPSSKLSPKSQDSELSGSIDTYSNDKKKKSCHSPAIQTISKESESLSSNGSKSSSSTLHSESRNERNNLNETKAIVGTKNKFQSDGSRTENSQEKRRKSEKTRIKVVGSGEREKVAVMMGARYRGKSKSWKPKPLSIKGSESELLGNLNVSKWDDNDDMPSFKKRARLVDKLGKKIKNKKRKMRLERWDSVLDEGRKKKVKIKLQEDPSIYDPGNNSFQRIQSDMQRKSRGAPKGLPNFKKKDVRTRYA